ncbi:MULTISPECIES: dihydrofolate reductase family protein [Prauserella salsuginis group]|uniref:Dihydrofolate reductase family protein n=1 Tax=Prauserella salsuginis TaxID=387889 RepID=A0ABW6GAY7_9PSEU|nr:MULTISPECIES: dihydrofolate reductase family protein [Prauserella salsuginis group]MCR3722402.1 Dihydrofolate reductase [Prauserella flava]MCR3736844.1 Dihydrofolate reductase [Prauserella salsuginis]
MGALSYTATMSLDGYVADANGDFDRLGPSAEVFQSHVDRMGMVSTEVLGRNTYLLMRYWESAPADGSWGAAEHEFARRWRGIEHIVASSTLTRDDLASERDRLVPDLDLGELERIVAQASGEVEIFGPTTASAAIRAGLVQNFRFFVVPKVVGGGLRAVPEDTQLDLRLAEHRIFDNGTAYLHYTQH